MFQLSIYTIYNWNIKTIKDIKYFVDNFNNILIFPYDSFNYVLNKFN